MSYASTCGVTPHFSVTEVASSREDLGQVMAVGDLDGHLVADRAARLDDGGHTALGGQGDGVAEGEVGVGGQHRPQRAISGAMEGDLCPGADPAYKEPFIELCEDECAAQPIMLNVVNSNNCPQTVEIIKGASEGFAAFCDGDLAGDGN